MTDQFGSLWSSKRDSWSVGRLGRIRTMFAQSGANNACQRGPSLLHSAINSTTSADVGSARSATSPPTRLLLPSHHHSLYWQLRRPHSFLSAHWGPDFLQILLHPHILYKSFCRSFCSCAGPISFLQTPAQDSRWPRRLETPFLHCHVRALQ